MVSIRYFLEVGELRRTKINTLGRSKVEAWTGAGSRGLGSKLNAQNSASVPALVNRAADNSNLSLNFSGLDCAKSVSRTSQPSRGFRLQFARRISRSLPSRIVVQLKRKHMPGWIHGIRQLIRFVFQGDMGRRALPIINFQVNCLVHPRCPPVIQFAAARYRPADCRPEPRRDGPPNLVENARVVLRTSGTSIGELDHGGFYLRRIVPYVRTAPTSPVWSSPLPISLRPSARRKGNRSQSRRERGTRRACARADGRIGPAFRTSWRWPRYANDKPSPATCTMASGQELNAASIKLDAHVMPRGESLRCRAGGNCQIAGGSGARNAQLTAQLNPPVLEQLGLVPAIEWLSEEMRIKTYQLEVVLDDDLRPNRWTRLRPSILFRAVRELLINVVRHSKVKLARVATRCV